MVRDRRIIFAASFLRASPTPDRRSGGIYLAQLGLDPAAWGAVLGAGIAGTAVGARGYVLGRPHRPQSAGWSGSGARGGRAASSSPFPRRSWCSASPRLGMLNSLGKDRAAGARDRAGDPALHRRRCRPHARLRVVQRHPGRGARVGAALAVLPPLLRDFAGVDPLASLRAAVILYAALYAVTAFSTRLSRRRSHRRRRCGPR